MSRNHGYEPVSKFSGQWGNLAQISAAFVSYPNAAAARAATSPGYLQDQYVLPYAINWNFGVTHVFHNDYTLEVRYLGTKGVHLPVQEQINVQPVSHTN